MGNKKNPTPATQWKGKLKVEGVPLDLPSENVALVRQISPQAFITSGLIPDPLRPIIMQAINTKKGLPPSQMKRMIDDPDLLSSAMKMFDTTLCYVVVEPAITMPPTCEVCAEGGHPDEYADEPQHHDPANENYHKYKEGPRDPEVLYADEVDMTDKQFIFQWALGGTKKLEPFREELEATVGSLHDGQGVQDETVGASGSG